MTNTIGYTTTNTGAEEYEYRGLMAKTWDLFRGDTSQWADKLLFRDLIAEYGQPVLDIGCGTGRLLVDFLAEGIDIDGMDNSPEMLQICRDKATLIGLTANVYLQTMETLDLPRQYRTVLVPSSSFQLILDKTDAQEALRRFVNHLEPGGHLVMPFMIYGMDDSPEEPEWRLTGDKTDPADGVRYRRYSRARFDRVNRLEHTETRYEAERDGQILATEYHQRSPATRLYTQEEAVRLFGEVNLTDIEVLSEFTRTPAKPEDTLFTLVGKR